MYLYIERSPDGIFVVNAEKEVFAVRHMAVLAVDLFCGIGTFQPFSVGIGKRLSVKLKAAVKLVAGAAKDRVFEDRVLCGPVRRGFVVTAGAAAGVASAAAGAAAGAAGRSVYDGAPQVADGAAYARVL